MRKTYVLVILDGWGVGKEDQSNPIYTARPEHMNAIETSFPCGALQASGLPVGMHWDEEGNSEVGHLTLGAGSVTTQHYRKISLAIEDGSFFTNPALTGAFAHARTSESAVHLVGLAGEGIVHSALPHLAALVKMAKQENCTKLFLHLITDGRDSAPHEAEKTLAKVAAILQKEGVGTIASVMGRYYAMDRDQHFDRVRKAYDTLTGGPGKNVGRPEEALQTAYAKGMNDEYVEPTTVGEAHPIQANDAIIFFNFREDRMRELSGAFVDPAFGAFPRKELPGLYVATMTEYKEGVQAAIAFKREMIKETLGKVLADNGKVQLRIAETEKYAHVTYFFNGLREKPYPNEFRVLIPSKNVVHYEDHPEMMASAITERAIVALNEGGFDFILVNYANPDIIAHTGNYDATVKAVKTIDYEIGRLMESVLQGNHVLMITSDHGNAEVVLNLQTGEPETRHDANPVPFYLIGNEFKKATPERPRHLENIGIISDVAPTVLALMGIRKPKEMTGQNLLDQLL